MRNKYKNIEYKDVIYLDKCQIINKCGQNDRRNDKGHFEEGDKMSNKKNNPR